MVTRLVRLGIAQDVRDFFDCVPIARGRRHAQELLDLAQVADRLHLPSIQTQDELVLDRNDLQEPVIVRGQTERKRRRRAKSLVLHIHEARYVRARRVS